MLDHLHSCALHFWALWMKLASCRAWNPDSSVSASRANCRVETESGGTRRSTGGEVKGKEANGVGSQQSCTVSEHGLSSITTVDAHTSAASSRLNLHPRRYKWTRPFHWKTESGFCACAITFRFHSTTWLAWLSSVRPSKYRRLNWLSQRMFLHSLF